MNKKTVVFTLLIVFMAQIFFAQEKTWIIASEKFSYARGQAKNSITEATAESIPVGIMEKMSRSLARTIMPDEKLERTRYDLRKSRLSLYLQLSAEYKKRDSILLNDYKNYELKSKLKASEKTITEIQEKIDANLKELAEAEKTAEENNKIIASRENSNSQETELDKYSEFFSRLLMEKESIVTVEKIAFYKDDNTKLFTPSETIKDASYSSYEFINEMVNQKIDTLITGVITSYGQYTSVNVTVYAYPGGLIIGNVTEVGSMQEMDLLTSSIARQLIPLITNAMPVNVEFSITPKDKNVNLYIDDILQQPIPESMLFDSGVHNLQFVCDGYETISTNYFFAGNEKYKIDVNMIPVNEGSLKIGLLKPIDGLIYANGLATQQIDSRVSRIVINGNAVLGEFISEDGLTDFYFIPQKLNQDGKEFVINPKPRDRSAYIDKRRKWMYGAYTGFMISLIPTFTIYGRYYNSAMYYNEYAYGKISYEDMISAYDEAVQWQNYYRASLAVSIAAGSYFAFELFRYFNAANSVLPKKVKTPTKKQSSMFVMPEIYGTAALQTEELEKKDTEDETKSDDENNDSDVKSNNEITTEATIEVDGD